MDKNDSEKITVPHLVKEFPYFVNKVHHHNHTSTSASLAMSRIQSTLSHPITSSQCFSNGGWRTIGGTRHGSSEKTPLSAGSMGRITMSLQVS
jgi:hypothetical protein